MNTTIAAEKAREDKRYRAPENRKAPTRIDSRLVVFDCITCEKCIPVCPNDANFLYPTPIVSFDFHDLLVAEDGSLRHAGEARRFAIDRDMQIANYADFCNECGNCDTFCPEYGGPYIKKPSFYGSLESWRKAAPRDGFVVVANGAGAEIIGRIKGRECKLVHDGAAGLYRYWDGAATVTFSSDHQAIETRMDAPLGREHRVDVGVYHTLRHLLHGVLDARRTNQINMS